VVPVCLPDLGLDGQLSTNIRPISGDWILCCDECGAKNILVFAGFTAYDLSRYEVVGWRE
jgi:hypothetical protein